MISASGKEHSTPLDHGQFDNFNDLPFLRNLNPGDPMAWRNYSQQYQYDGVGNILQMQHIANGGSWTRDYEYETDNNRLNSTTVGNSTYTYPHHEQHGFMNSMPHLSVMEWNFKDELQSVAQQVVDGGIPETTYYVYDGSGERVRKVTENSGGTSIKDERLYLGGVEIYRKRTGANAGLERITLHVMDDSSRIAMIDRRNGVDDGTDTLTVRYQFGNHLGSAALEVDETGRVLSYEEYHPFGTTAYQASDASVRMAAKRYRYTGMERDEETGFGYHGARYYLSWLGRWCAADPIGLRGGLNFYTYVNNRPIILRDPSGNNGSLVGDLWDSATFLYDSSVEVGARSIEGVVEGTRGIREDPLGTLSSIHEAAVDQTVEAIEGVQELYKNADEVPSAVVGLTVETVTEIYDDTVEAFEDVGNSAVEYNEASVSGDVNSGADALEKGAAAAGKIIDTVATVVPIGAAAGAAVKTAGKLGTKALRAGAKKLASKSRRRRKLPEQGRDKKGKFLPKKEGESSPGSTHQDEVGDVLREIADEGSVISQPKIQTGEFKSDSWTPDYAAKINGKPIVVDAKSSSSAKRTPAQEHKIPVFESKGGILRKPGVTGKHGIKLPPSKVREVTPEVLKRFKRIFLDKKPK